MSLYLKQLEVGPMQNFVYLIGDHETKECAIVDPAWDAPSIVQAAEKDGMKLSKIFITHWHPDHVNGVEALLEKAECKIYVQKREQDFMQWKWPNLVKLSDGDTVEIGKIKVRVIHTPGHTGGSQCLEIDNNLISGDTLFINSCGRIDLPGSNPQEMYESLQKLRALNDNVILFPGHNYASHPTSTIGEEKANNPYLKFPNLQTFLSVMGSK